MPHEDLDFNLSPEEREMLLTLWTLPDDGKGNCVVLPNVETSARNIAAGEAIDVIIAYLERDLLANTFQSFTKPPHVSRLRRLWHWVTA